jgi:hypothetical protein
MANRNDHLLKKKKKKNFKDCKKIVAGGCKNVDLWATLAGFMGCLCGYNGALQRAT